MKSFSKYIALLSVLAFANGGYGQLTFNGTIDESSWGSPLATSAGGPTSGFGAGHEINALYATGDSTNIYFGLAGNVQSGNSILLFIDTNATTTDGFNNGGFNRTNAPGGVDDFNSGTTFDNGFYADFVLRIGTNGSTYYFDLYTLSSNTGSNNFLGTGDTAGFGADPFNSSNTRGFEVTLPKATLGYSNGNDIEVFALYTSDGGFLSNQFLTVAGSSEGNYTDGVVNFSAAAPNPILINATVVPEPSTYAAFAGLVMLGYVIWRRRAVQKV